jgi:hypothetical protein
MDQEQVRLWKEQYGQVFSASVRGEDYVFRALTYSEFDRLRAGGVDSSADAEERVVEVAVLHPSPLPERVPAGVVTALAQQIFEFSGFGSLTRMREVLEQKRARAAGDIRTVMKVFVLCTMPSYREEDLDELTFDKLAAKVALAEQILKLHQTSVGMENELRLELIDPEEQAAAEDMAKQRYAMTKKPGTAGMGDPVAERLRAALG